MGISVYDSASLLNSISEGDIDASSFATLASAQNLPLTRAVETGANIKKVATSDYTRWGLGFNKMSGPYATQYRAALRRDTPRPTSKLALRLNKHEVADEAFDNDEIDSHRKAGETAFADFLKTIIDQAAIARAEYTERQLMYVPNAANDETGTHGVMTWLQPARNNSGVVVANDDGGFTGDRVLWSDGTTHTTGIAGVDRSLAANAKYRNYNVSIPEEVGADAVQALRKGLAYTGFQKHVFASERVSYGNLKNGASGDMAELMGRMQTANRLICGMEDFQAWSNYVESISPDDNGGDAVKFNKVRVAGCLLEYSPLLDPDHELYLDGEGTIYPTRPLYLVNWAKWVLPHLNGLWDPTEFMPDPQNPGYQVIRQRRATFNLRPQNDLRPAGMVMYRI